MERQHSGSNIDQLVESVGHPDGFPPVSLSLSDAFSAVDTP